MGLGGQQSAPLYSGEGAFVATASSSSSSSKLATPVQFLKGVGPERARLLERLNLRTAGDVLFNFPRDYEQVAEHCLIRDLKDNVTARVTATVEEVELRATGPPGRCVLGVLFRDASGYLRGVWFNQPYMRERFARGQRWQLQGTPRLRGLRWEMAHPHLQLADEEEEEACDDLPILPIYRLTEGLRQSHMRRIVRNTLDARIDAVEEVLPDSFRDAHQLWPIRQALPQIHFPTDDQHLARARHRFVFQELLVLQYALAMRRHQLTSVPRAISIPVTHQIDARIRRLLPYTLTAGQDAAIGEISADMAREIPMNRLLQGDVGSGKTAVAVYAMLTAIAHGCQAALMAPTEILALQHHDTIRQLLAQARVRIALWTGQLTASERKETKARIERGEVDLIVGTHAIIQDELSWPRLALVVIDEQHRFGVRQRARLKSAGSVPHYLVMTATPIPRTIALTAYGDLDVTHLRGFPAGRQTVHTYLVTEERREAWWVFFRKQLRQGRQGYVITPLIDTSDEDDLTGVHESFEALCNGELEAFRLDLVHGQMTTEQKQDAMRSFRAGDTQVLVATSIVEVGVDVPNATVMTIENAERFGLAQLHQLRGRVGRGCHPGFVGVCAHPTTEQAQQRLEALVATSDGFELAEVDFRLRGPGELLGLKQHGLPPMRIADLARDEPVLLAARQAAQALVAADPAGASPDFAGLYRQVRARYGHTLELADVG
jgi:ATP-dependent DNA helicase RecG